MKKSTLFLSAAITTFILVVLASVIFKARASGFGSPTSTATPAASLAPTDTEALQPTDTPTTRPTVAIPPTATLSSFINPQEAAFIAASALGNTQIFSIDTVTRYGMDVYQVNFSSGAIVFVSPQGHILTITSLQSNVVPATPVPQTNNQQASSNNSPAQQSQGSDDNHSGGDD
jgi:hypothetical protein